MHVAELQGEGSELKFDRSKWESVSIGDIVRCVKTDADPVESGLVRYVAGEHMTSGSLQISSWGTIGDGYLGPAFHRYFKAGQVLFGSRRPYLKKVALAEFEGICANTTLVLEPKDGRVCANIFPFILSAEPFLQHAIKMMRGSVNPYVNWSDLTDLQLTLPTLDDQHRIAEMLWSAEDTTRRFREAVVACRAAAKAIFADLASRAELLNLGSLCSIRSGTTPKRSEKRYWTPEYPWLSTSQVNDRIITEAREFVSHEALRECSLPICPRNSTLVALYGEGKTRGMSAFLAIEATINQAFACLVPNERLLPMFLFLALESSYEDLRHASQGSNQKNLSGSLLSQFKIPCPERQIQEQVIAKVEQLLILETACHQRANEAIELRRRLSAAIWSEAL